MREKQVTILNEIIIIITLKNKNITHLSSPQTLSHSKMSASISFPPLLFFHLPSQNSCQPILLPRFLLPSQTLVPPSFKTLFFCVCADAEIRVIASFSFVLVFLLCAYILLFGYLWVIVEQKLERKGRYVKRCHRQPSRPPQRETCGCKLSGTLKRLYLTMRLCLPPLWRLHPLFVLPMRLRRPIPESLISVSSFCFCIMHHVKVVY